MHALRRLLPVLLLAVVSACGGGTTTTAPTAAPTTAAPTAAPTDTPAAAPTAAPTDTPTAAPTTAAPTTAATEPAGTPQPVEIEAVLPFESPDGERVTFDVEVVSDQESRQVGLMHRTELAEGTGMLFVFPDDSFGGFWMKNTLIPLQIAYIDAGGEIVDILEMEPCVEDPCPSYVPDGPYRYALEVNAGAFDEAGIDDTWTVDIPDDLPEAT